LIYELHAFSNTNMTATESFEKAAIKYRIMKFYIKTEDEGQNLQEDTH